MRVSDICDLFGAQVFQKVYSRLKCTSNSSVCGDTPLQPHITCDTSNITVLSFNSMDLIGRLPSSLKLLNHLKTLDLTHNRLSGTVPDDLSLSLQNLDLSFNYLTGSIPSSIGLLSALTIMDVGLNYLTGKIPSSIGNCASLEALYMDNNSLQGSIPSSLGQLTALVLIFLDINNLSGRIPSSLSTLKLLQVLKLASNHLSGIIPTFLSSTSSLAIISLEENDLTGTIPNSLGFSGQLTDVILTNNKLSGSLPASLCFSKGLKKLLVKQNPGLTCYTSCLSTVSQNDYVGVLPVCPGPPPTVMSTSYPTASTPITISANSNMSEVTSQLHDAIIACIVLSVLLILSVSVLICLRYKKQIRVLLVGPSKEEHDIIVVRDPDYFVLDSAVVIQGDGVSETYMSNPVYMTADRRQEFPVVDEQQHDPRQATQEEEANTKKPGRHYSYANRYKEFKFGVVEREQTEL